MEDRLENYPLKNDSSVFFHALNTAKISAGDIFKEILHYSGADFCFVGMEKNGRIFVHDLYGIALPTI